MNENEAYNDLGEIELIDIDSLTQEEWDMLSSNCTAPDICDEIATIRPVS